MKWLDSIGDLHLFKHGKDIVIVTNVLQFFCHVQGRTHDTFMKKKRDKILRVVFRKRSKEIKYHYLFWGRSSKKIHQQLTPCTNFFSLYKTFSKDSIKLFACINTRRTPSFYQLDVIVHRRTWAYRIANIGISNKTSRVAAST